MTYRSFADEYRVWQGTDVNVAELTAAAHERIADQPLHQVLNDIYELEPIVAARHSAQNETLRLFRRRFVHGDETVKPPAALDAIDGDVLLVTGTERNVPTLADEVLLESGRSLRSSDSPWALRTKPVVAALPDDVSVLDRAGS